MSWIKKNALFLSLVIFVYGAFFLFNQTPHKAQISVLGARSNLYIFEEPEDGRKPILDAIDNAQQEILVEMYLLSDKQIINALTQEKEKGIAVKVLLEKNPFNGGSLNTQAKKTLENSGVNVQWTNPSFTLTHEKTIVIDNKEVFILNQNLTSSSFGKNREFNIIDENSRDITEIKNIFNADWQRKSYTPTVSQLVVSPDNAREKLMGLLQNSAKQIDIEMEILDDKDIVSLLMEKAKTTQIKIIIPDLSKVSSNKDVAVKLKNAGILIKIINKPYIHAKLILSDNTKAYIGSVNATTRSMDQNRELGIIISQENIITNIVNVFETDWSKATEL